MSAAESVPTSQTPVPVPQGDPPDKESHLIPPRGMLAKASDIDLAEMLLLGVDLPAKPKGEKASDAISETWIGRCINDYRIEEELGRGGMGAVFRATNTRVGSPLALKLMRFPPGETAERLRRFELEARAAAELNHPHIVNVFDFGQSGDLYFMAMEYIEGKPLSQLLSHGPLDPQRAVKISLDVFEALEFAHHNGVIHRDIKPSNILIEPSGDAQLMDFGLARRSDPSSTRHTEIGAIMGTAHYMSPEQAQGLSHTADHRSDIYSAGAVLYEMLTGRPPHDGKTPLDVIQKAAHDDPLPISRVRANIDRDLEVIVMKAMDKNPQRRYRSAHLLSEDLKRYAAGEPIHARPPSLLYRARKYLAKNRAWTLPVAVCLMIVGMIVLGYTLRDRKFRLLMEQVLIERTDEAKRVSQEELEKTVRKRLLEIDTHQLLDPASERWRLYHALRLTGKMDEAEAELKHLKELYTNDPTQNAYVWLWVLLNDFDRYKVLNRETLANAISMAKKGKNDDALAIFAALQGVDFDQLRAGRLAYRPMNVEGYDAEYRALLSYYLGHLATRAGDTDQALQLMEQAATQGNPNRLETHLAVTELHLLKTRPADASK